MTIFCLYGTGGSHILPINLLIELILEQLEHDVARIDQYLRNLSEYRQLYPGLSLDVASMQAEDLIHEDMHTEDMIIINIESSPTSTVSELPAHNNSYSVYEVSSNHMLFSAGFIASLTVDQCLSLFLPLVLSPNTVRLVGWSKTVPSVSSINFQLLGAFIPCGKDIRTFLGDQKQQYKEMSTQFTTVWYNFGITVLVSKSMLDT
ncbi:hypothetical protein EDD85DRAFT_795717 [Armillaria nabsnona]|nr:hypothetical protein EDD85DRAFT_795717 [Armillaria nabsnona]